MREGGRLTLAALRHRPGQAVALFVLGLLAVGACAFGPLYERAVEAAQLRATLVAADLTASGISLRATGPGDSPPDLPAAIRPFMQPPVTTVSVPVAYSVNRAGAGPTPVAGSLVDREGVCARLHLVAGGCPQTVTDVLVSETEAKAAGWRVGAEVALPNSQVRLAVAGLYAVPDPADPYWFERRYATSDGLTLLPGSPLSASSYEGDAFFTAPGAIASLAARLANGAANSVSTTVDAALRPPQQIGLDRLPTLRVALAQLTTAGTGSGSTYTASTGLAGLLTQVASGRHQARVIIPALAAEVAVLLLLVVAVVVVAAADQRQGEIALGRLRGLGARTAARPFRFELQLVVLLAAVPGAAVGWLACALAGRWWLGGRAAPELRWPVLLAAVLALVLQLALIAVVAARTARRPVQDLLRRIPARTSGWRLGLLEVAVGVAAAAATLTLATGSRTDPVALVAPGLLALTVGLLLSRLLVPLARRAARSRIWAGRLVGGLAAVQIARRTGLRRLAVLICVATALAVAAADEWSVARTNRSVRAAVATGAPVVLDVRSSAADVLERAVAAGDPSGTYATPVLVQQPPNGPALAAVRPDQYRQVAGWGWQHDKPASGVLAALDPHRPAPVELTGTSVRLTMQDLRVTRRTTAGPGTPGPAYLTLRLDPRDRPEVLVQLGPLTSSAEAGYTATVPCATGCRLGRIGLVRASGDGDDIEVAANAAALAAGTGTQRPVPLGVAADWPSLPGGTTGDVISFRDAAGGLQLQASSLASSVEMQHGDVPAALPAIAAALPAGQSGVVQANNVDGLSTPLRLTAALPFAPGVAGAAYLVDLDLAVGAANGLSPGTAQYVYLAREDPARERQLVAALRQAGVTVGGRDTAAAHRTALSASAPAWAMQLALVCAAIGVLIAAVVLLLTMAMTRRSRRADTGALRRAGVRAATLRRAGLLEQAMLVIGGASFGAVIGAIGARIALPGIPIFLSEQAVPAVLRPLQWPAILLAALVTCVVLLGAAAATVGDR